MQFVASFVDGTGSQPDKFPHVTLKQIKWDDFGYRTTFLVQLHLDAENIIDLGSVKILQSGQRDDYTIIPREPFSSLSDNHCSLGASLDYYEALFKLGPKLYKPYLIGLKDVAFDDHILGVSIAVQRCQENNR